MRLGDPNPALPAYVTHEMRAPELDGSWRGCIRRLLWPIWPRLAALPVKKRRAYLRELYPYGERKYWPYKVWCDEIARLEGRKRPLHSPLPVPPDPNQMELEL